ncbi:hypothetical protein [Deinococcus radiophilus]|uniref:hypothetical protein n=1 Tax=Deinococcus radiophilus TaxID=32062 RepID=UPI0036137F50
MPQYNTFAALALAALGSTALALPPLPASEVADRAVQSALSSAPIRTEAARGLPYVGLSPTVMGQQSSELIGARAPAGRTAVLKSTAYNSLAAQTDSSPHITATGTAPAPAWLP